MYTTGAAVYGKLLSESPDNLHSLIHCKYRVKEQNSNKFENGYVNLFLHSVISLVLINRIKEPKMARIIEVYLIDFVHQAEPYL